jgi:hypothetical protein
MYSFELYNLVLFCTEEYKVETVFEYQKLLQHCLNYFVIYPNI